MALSEEDIAMMIHNRILLDWMAVEAELGVVSAPSYLFRETLCSAIAEAIHKAVQEGIAD